MKLFTHTLLRRAAFGRSTVRSDALPAMLYRSEGFAEDLFDSHPTGALMTQRQPRRDNALTATVAAAVLATLAACVAPPASLPHVAASESAFVIDLAAMPAPQAPFDVTVITAVESAGASRTE